MNFLFDENLPAKLAPALRELGEPVRQTISPLVPANTRASTAGTHVQPHRNPRTHVPISYGLARVGA